jgi:hypothetical protein
VEKRIVRRTMRVKTREILRWKRPNLRRLFGSGWFPPVGQQFLDSVCRVGLEPFAVGNEEKSDAPERDPMQSRFRFVVIGRNGRVTQKAAEGVAIFEQVPDGSRDTRFWFESASMFSSPYKQPREKRARFCFPQSKMSVSSAS